MTTELRKPICQLSTSHVAANGLGVYVWGGAGTLRAGVLNTLNKHATMTGIVC